MRSVAWVCLAVSGCCLLFPGAIASRIDDTIHYYFTFKENAEKIQNAENINSKETPMDEMKIRTRSNEQFTCRLPHVVNEEESDESNINYSGPSPNELLGQIYKDNKCSYLIDTYWTYELCHGRYVVQFHEQMTVKGVLRTEYYLGNYHKDYTNLKDRSNELTPPKRAMAGEEYPYFTVLYTQGTTCDLTGKPRTIEVLYVCAEGERARILSITETSSCRYEMIVMTEILCQHPKYKLTAKKDFEITCYAANGKKPVSLQRLDQFHDETFKREFTITHDKEWDEMEDVEVSSDPEDFPSQRFGGSKEPKEVTYRLAGKKRYSSVDTLANNKAIVEHTVNNILTGRECIYGGTGWWKYELCYGNRVIQYHQEADGKRTEILLGTFDEQVHKAWVDLKPKERQPKKYEGRITQISHLYSKGQTCDETKAHRSIEVRMRCTPEAQAQSSLAISLTLHEPKTCQYILIVESARFCEPLQYADDYGLIELRPVVEEMQPVPEPLRPDP